MPNQTVQRRRTRCLYTLVVPVSPAVRRRSLGGCAVIGRLPVSSAVSPAFFAMPIRISQRLDRFRDKRIKTEFGMSIMDRRRELGLTA